jgi:hypothetical protein
MMKEEPRKEHKWLEKLIGEWTFQEEATAATGEPPKYTGTERVRPLGGLWVLAEGQGRGPDGGPASMLLTLGYDPKRERYVGTWIGSMMSHLWVYDGGELDPSGRVLTLSAEGPDMEKKDKTARYRDVIEFKSDDERTLTAYVQGEDGQWRRLMSTVYRRAT